MPKTLDVSMLPQLRAAMAWGRPPMDPTIVETDIRCPVRDGTTIQLRCYRPATPLANGSPLFVNYHGGGHVFGDLNTSALFCRSLVAGHGAVVIDVDYRLAPEHVFPVGKDDAWDALLWVSKHYNDLAACPSRGFIVAGCSAGANIAASMALIARDQKLEPCLTGTYLNIAELVSPELKLPDKYAPLWLSREQNKAAPILNQSFIDFFMECYQPDFKSHHHAPAHDPQGHAGLPKTYIDVCGLDPYRDDGIIYERLLHDAGVSTKLTVFPGLPHGWWEVIPDLQETQEYHEKTREGMQWLLTDLP